MVQASVLPNMGAIDPSLILLDEKLPGGAYWHYVIKRGNTLRVTDLEAVSYTHLTLPTKRIV